MLKIREIRKARGLTMKQLGDMVGALESSISFYERGVQQPDLDMLKKIADALSVSTDELVDHNQDKIQKTTREAGWLESGDLCHDSIVQPRLNDSEGLH